jgi:50S ribosomal protein L16 3-hydroxylase
MATRRTSSPPATDPAIEVQATRQHPLGMPAAAFLRDYWQKHPLLVRGAFPALAAPGAVPPLTPEDLAGLACEEAALSRLVVHDRGTDTWSVRNGPFDEALFPTLGERDWSLLVQDVEKWDADVAALLEAFDFLPRWRIDDVMVSFAAPGGSVGAHVDHYDVFLLQAQGHRHWWIDASEAPPLAFHDDAEMKLLRAFTPSHDWVLGPGDMLYLPPGVPHHGVAEDACLTCSIGMRAPSVAELMGDYIDTLAATADDSLRYGDADLAPARDRNEIDAAAMARVVAALNRLRMADADALGDWFGRFITEYRSAGAVDAGEDMPPRIEVEWALQQGAALQRHPWTRMAWRKAGAGQARGAGHAARLYVSGDAHALPVADARRIADAGLLDGCAYAALSETGRDCVFALFEAGHYRLADETQQDPEEPRGPAV